MGVVFLVLAIVCIVLYFAFHRSADKLDAQFANRPATIVNPANDLFQNQKTAKQSRVGAWDEGSNLVHQ